MGEEREKALARERALVILQVHSGSLTAQEGARRLGVSRKTYYEWEQRALGAMTLALENRPPGRLPVPVDEENERLRRQVKELEQKLFLTEKAMEVKELRWAYESLRGDSGEKNRQAAGKSRRGDQADPGDHRRGERAHQKILPSGLSSPAGSQTQLQPMAPADEGRRGCGQRSGPQEGRSIRSGWIGRGHPLFAPWNQAQLWNDEVVPMLSPKRVTAATGADGGAGAT